MNLIIISFLYWIINWKRNQERKSEIGQSVFSNMSKNENESQERKPRFGIEIKLNYYFSPVSRLENETLESMLRSDIKMNRKSQFFSKSEKEKHALDRNELSYRPSLLNQKLKMKTKKEKVRRNPGPRETGMRECFHWNPCISGWECHGVDRLG